MRTLFGLVVFCLLALQFADAQTTVMGSLLDQDGEPLQMGNISITRYVNEIGAPSAETTEVRKDGKYSITIDSAGVWELVFAGVNHASCKIPIYVNKPEKIHLDVRLATYDFADTFTDISVEGRFNDFNPYSAVPMKKEQNGTFMAEFHTENDSSFAYEIVGATRNKTPINGTESERYIYDSRWGSYKSVVIPKNKGVRIIFDPGRLVRSDKPARVEFADSQSFDAEFARVFSEMMNEQKEWTAAYLKHKAQGNNANEFKYDWSGVLRSLNERIAHETNPMLLQELYLNYIWLHDFGADIHRSVFRAALKECSPDSWIWSLDPFLFVRLLEGAGVNTAEYDRLMRAFTLKSPCMWEMKALLLEEEMSLEKMNGDTARATFCYNLLENRYGSTPYGKAAKAEYSQKGERVAVGKEAPLFSITSLQDSTQDFTNASFKGKYLLVDFWATWCGPCVAEMGYLQKAYDEFKDKNFVMLSVSFDKSPEDVELFRKERWHMPWLQAFAYGGWKNKMVEDFETFAIPHPILISPAGKIIATGVELRGDNLEKTLEKFLGKYFSRKP